MYRTQRVLNDMSYEGRGAASIQLKTVGFLLLLILFLHVVFFIFCFMFSLGDIVKILNKFYRRKEVKQIAAASGIDGKYSEIH